MGWPAIQSIRDAVIFYLNCAGRTGTSMLGSQRRRNVERIRTLMESGDDMGIEAIAKAIVFYQSCMQGDDLNSSYKFQVD